VALLGNLSLFLHRPNAQDRLPVKTFLVPQNKYDQCYDWIRQQIKTNHTQVYIVCPFISDSDEMQTVKSAESEFEKLKQIYPEFKLALIHGKIAPKTRDKIISDFKDNKINILVTTPIIEVGIDIPNASIIIIQSADHFGLAQLHQLRGRVGRGQHQSYCYLFTQSTSQNSVDRLRHLDYTTMVSKSPNMTSRPAVREKFFHISSMGFFTQTRHPHQCRPYL
jgi:ATP-dependent DNA helicase RecG